MLPSTAENALPLAAQLCAFHRPRSSESEAYRGLRTAIYFGTGGNGTTPHIAGEVFKVVTGVQMTHVPYKGGGPALADLVGGQIQLMLENIPSTLPFVKSGRLRGLAVSGLKRSALVPNLPTLDEAGLKGYEIVGWNGLFVPARTPKTIVARIHQETVKLLAQPDVKQRLEAALLGVTR